ncbi:hypothetical protein GMSM_14660 [Geomonas sp. Red276]
MGTGRFTDADWDRYTTTHIRGRSTSTVFSSRSLHPALNPHGVGMRESRDSADNPNSHAIIVDVDVTGSMGFLADVMVRQGCHTLATEIYARKPVSDPHVMFMANGDVECDRAPLQITQFEADIRIAEQLRQIWLEGGGGGNSHESYLLPWYFAAMHTSIDCFEKRGKKGYLFTAGDEEPQMVLRASEIERVFGTRPQADLTAEALFAVVSRYYHVYHLMVEEGSHFRSYGDRVVSKWTRLMGERAIRLSDHTKMAEVIVSTIQVNEGADRDDVVASWNGDTSVAVRAALKSLTRREELGTGGFVRF